MAAERKQTTRNPTQSPDFALHRVVAEAVDVLPEQNEAHGVNMANDDEALISVCPEGGANPTIQVLFWSPGANAGNGQFVHEHTTIEFAGIGVNVPYQVRVPCKGRKMFVAVTAGNGAGHTTRVYVAGFNENMGR
jgi:hypothetical protein